MTLSLLVTVPSCVRFTSNHTHMCSTSLASPSGPQGKSPAPSTALLRTPFGSLAWPLAVFVPVLGSPVPVSCPLTVGPTLLVEKVAAARGELKGLGVQSGVQASALKGLFKPLPKVFQAFLPVWFLWFLLLVWLPCWLLSWRLNRLFGR